MSTRAGGAELERIPESGYGQHSRAADATRLRKHSSPPQFSPSAAAQVTDAIRFNVLGSLEVWAGRQRLPVGGPKQRAILGYLLVHANEVVATSQIVGALWPVRAPSTARKMLQNTVSNIRGLLSAHGGGSASTLLTHSPGYLLRIDAESLDLLHFEQLARAGKAALADGAWETASRSLRASLDLWRGEPLADLRDTGLNWSKLTVLRESRLTALEDYFEAESAVGRHNEHTAELEQLVSDEPHRERAAYQLMLALYRSGRQVDALEVYQRTRVALRDDLGLEPTQNLRDLERAILEHDASLRSPASGAPIQLESDGARSAIPALAAGRVVEPNSERTSLSILTIALDVHEGAEDVDALLSEVCAEVRDEVDAAGGTVLFYTGSMVQAVFGVPGTGEQDTLLTAVRTAVGLRDRFARAGGSVQPRLSIRTEDVLIKSRRGGIDVVSTALEQCVRTARTLPPSEVWVCDATRLRGGIDAADMIWRGRPAVWWAKVRPCVLDDMDLPFVDRDHELTILGQHLDQTIRRGRGRLVTVLGEAGIGKTRLMSQWVSRLQALPTPPPVLQAVVPPPGTPWAARTMVAELVACLRRVQTDELVEHVPATVEQLASVIERLGPTVFVMEDLHLADDATQEFIGNLTARIGMLPVLVVATARFQAPDQDRLHVRAFTTMTLDGISDAAVELLWNAVLAGDACRSRLSPQLTSKIDGNPLSAIEFARQRQDELRLRRDPLLWTGRRSM